MPGETTEAQPDTQQALNNLANGAHLKQKRARSQLSCIPCRQGKLKCNRQQAPACDQCIKRNRESSCLYVPPPTKQKPTQNVKGRIRQLETLVVDLMNQQNSKSPENGTAGQEKDRSTGNRDGSILSSEQLTPPSDNDASPHSQDDVEGATKPFGQMRISRNSISYVGDTHWQAILNGISELKRDLGDEDEAEGENGDRYDSHEAFDGATFDTYGNAWSNIPLEDLNNIGRGDRDPGANTGLGFMLGTSSRVTREQLIHSVPEKKVADRLLSLWFNSPDPFKPIIHAPTFQDEYRRFWRNPKDMPTMWLGLLFSILSLAASFGLRDVPPTDPRARATLATVNRYHTLAASAAVLADFTKSKQYTIECLILYSAGLRSSDAFVNVWLMLGLVVRLSLRMGYHRDPSAYPAISVFAGEMRRRTWAITSMIDVLISFQLGLPSMVKTIYSDTQPPRNLLDRDFGINTKVLPPGRGIDELTPSSYTRAKLRITRIFADASELSHATIPPLHEETMTLDRQLEEARAAIPPLLQMPDISELVTDPAEQLMCRFNLDLLYCKTKIVLHRRYMEKPFAQLTPHEQQMGIGVSRRACTTCALRVMQHHNTIYNASQAGGQLESVKWYMGSISTHDFLLAAMVICLELSQQIAPDSAVMNPTDKGCPQRAAMMNALEKSQKIWSDASGRKRKLVQFVARDEINKGEHLFDETEKAGRAMAVMLQKVKERFPQQANALARFNNVEQDTPTVELPMPTHPTSTSGPQTFYTSQGGDAAFGGVVSFHPWGNMNGVPEGANLDGINLQASSNGDMPLLSNSNTNTDSAETSPDQNSMRDFSMIGDMIDMPENLDWGIFDTGLTKAGTNVFTQELSSGEDLLMQNSNFNVTAGNALVGTNGTGPGNTSTQAFPGSWMLEDINFDMGNDDLMNGGLDNGNGLSDYGAGGFAAPMGLEPPTFDTTTGLDGTDSWRNWEM